MEVNTDLTHMSSQHIVVMSNRHPLAAIAVSRVHPRMVLIASFLILSTLSTCVPLNVGSARVCSITEKNPLYNRNTRRGLN